MCVWIILQLFIIGTYIKIIYFYERLKINYLIINNNNNDNSKINVTKFLMTNAIPGVYISA